MADGGHYDPREDPAFQRIRAAMDAHEAPYLEVLRGICEAIGYGRVIQVTEGWMEEKMPGWVRTHHLIALRDGEGNLS